MTRSFTHWDADYLPSDMGEGDFGGPCRACGWPRNQFNHTKVNCEKRKKEDWVIKNDEIIMDGI